MQTAQAAKAAGRSSVRIGSSAPLQSPLTTSPRRVPSLVVEPLISASMAFVAIENLAPSKLKPWRPALVLGFGLLHGLGFAGALSHFGLPQDEFVWALASLNLGIELAQLSVIAAAMITVGWLRYRPWYRSAISMPASAAIAAVAVYWTAQRVLG